VLFTVLALAGVWWAYPLLWLLPLMTWMMVITRIRNIAEHAVVPDSDDPLRNTRTTKANLLERAFIAPYFVNYHLEHHLLFYVPCYNLPKLHAILMRGPHAPRMEVQPGYAQVLRLATARPDTEDRPGAIVNNARRLHGGSQVGQDQASAGF
jgi:fatty acid desaturase